MSDGRAIPCHDAVLFLFNLVEWLEQLRPCDSVRLGTIIAGFNLALNIVGCEVKEKPVCFSPHEGLHLNIISKMTFICFMMFDYWQTTTVKPMAGQATTLLYRYRAVPVSTYPAYYVISGSAYKNTRFVSRLYFNYILSTLGKSTGSKETFKISPH